MAADVDAWTPTRTEEDAAVRLLADTLILPEDEQLDVLALLVRLWCHHREMRWKATA